MVRNKDQNNDHLVCLCPPVTKFTNVRRHHIYCLMFTCICACMHTHTHTHTQTQIHTLLMVICHIDNHDGE